MRMQVRSLGSLSGLRIRRCCELWCRLQTRLRSDMAVAVSGNYSSDSTPSLGISICHGSCPKKKNKNKNKNQKKAGIIYIRRIANSLIVSGQERFCRKTARPLSTESNSIKTWQNEDNSHIKIIPQVSYSLHKDLICNDRKCLKYILG